MSIVTEPTFSISGSENIVFNNIDSNIDLKPLAPVFLLIAFFAISLKASSLNSSWTFSNSNSLLYCLVSEFFGSFKIFINDFSSKSSSVVTIGILPTNSGIKPYLIKSSGSSFLIKSETLLSSLLTTLAPKPIEVSLPLASITLSSPANAPPQINSMFVVSTCKNSCWGCFLPPCGGTLATVPSIIFNRACWTPSPETSRVIEGFSDFLLILSTSSI